MPKLPVDLTLPPESRWEWFFRYPLVQVSDRNQKRITERVMHNLFAAGYRKNGGMPDVSTRVVGEDLIVYVNGEPNADPAPHMVQAMVEPTTVDTDRDQIGARLNALAEKIESSPAMGRSGTPVLPGELAVGLRDLIRFVQTQFSGRI